MGEPFVMLPVSVLTMKGLSDRAVRLYAVLVMHRNGGSGRCNPSRKTLATELGTNLRAVDYATKELDRAGLIRRARSRPGGPTEYTLPTAIYCSTPAQDVAAPTAKYGSRVLQNVADKLDEVNQTKERDTPLPPEDGRRWTYAASLNSKYPTALSVFRTMSSELSEGWFRRVLIEAETEVGPIDREALLKGLGSASEAMKRALMAEGERGGR